MKIIPFQLERYFAKYEFNTKYLLSSSECQALTHNELLKLADLDDLNLYDKLSLGYTQSSGHPILLKEISKLYDTISTERILTIAPQEGIFIALNVLLKPGDHMICTYPGYQSLYEIGRSIGCDISYWKAQYNEDGTFFDIDDLKSQIKDNTKLIVINFPHNPTGYMPTLEEYNEIVDIAKNCGAYLFSDEMYRYLERAKEKTLPFACDLYDKAVSLMGLSKSMSLPGLRIGWLCSRDEEVMEECKQYRDYLTICSAAPSEILAIIALKSKERIIMKNKKIIDSNLKLLHSFMKENEESFSYYEPRAGSICYPRYKGNKKVGDFCAELAKKNEVMLLPCDVYGENNNRFRIGYGKEDFHEALEALGNYLKQ